MFQINSHLCRSALVHLGFWDIQPHQRLCNYIQCCLDVILVSGSNSIWLLNTAGANPIVVCSMDALIISRFLTYYCLLDMKDFFTSFNSSFKCESRAVSGVYTDISVRLHVGHTIEWGQYISLICSCSLLFHITQLETSAVTRLYTDIGVRRHVGHTIE